MSVENEFLSFTIPASADFSTTHQHKAVTLGGLVAGAGVAAIGLLKSKPGNGEHARVGYFGIMKAYSGAVINSGSALQIANSGFIVPFVAAVSSLEVASGDFLPGVDLPIGRALDQVASGDLFKGMYNFVNVTNV